MLLPNAVKTSPARIANGDGTNLITVVTPGAQGQKVTSLIASSDDTAARDLQLVITKGAVDYPLGTVAIPITAGTIAATPHVDLLAPGMMPGLPTDSDGNPYLLLETGAVLKAKVLVAVTAAKFINIIAKGGDFAIV